MKMIHYDKIQAFITEEWYGWMMMILMLMMTAMSNDDSNDFDIDYMSQSCLWLSGTRIK